MFRILLLLFSCGLVSTLLSAQETTASTFSDTRIINTHSVETLPARKLELRIGHRFGDIAGNEGGWSTFYGLENAADILIGVDYGFTDRLTGGLFRTKGAGSLRQLLHLNGKYRILEQSKHGISVTGIATVTASTMERRPESTGLNRFPDFSHRFIYHGQAVVARRFSDDFSLQLSGGYLHRNLVADNDDNNLIHVGLASRLRISKVIALLVDIDAPITGDQSPFSDSENNPYQLPVGVGVEINTGGHIFQINLTNTEGITAADYLPYTTSDWLDGAFRLGFTINRRFNL